MTPSPPHLTLGIDVDAPADVAWDLLVRVDQWPRWGPTVRRAVVDGGADRIAAGATGTVWTTPGPPLPFRIEAWEPHGPVRHWSWRVAGVTATGHTVRERQGGCRVEFTAPWWAPGYAPVLWLGLRRVRSLARARRGRAAPPSRPAGDGTTG
ncbi:SRPBCC family protein [Knoellia sp. CPCC 206435]|uniref:SRPBCC family protein n=1 Tax=Knoellia terrae TaxID=3404797 RepID=UPI003B43C316